MTDVLRIALERREQLQQEITRLDEFIRTAEQLIRTQTGPRSANDEADHTGPTRMNLLRRGGSLGG